MSIEVTIEEVNPVTVYQDTVYEHHVVLRLEDGTRFGVFDADLIARPSLVGSERSVLVRAWILRDFNHCSKPSMRIFPNEIDNTEWGNHRYEGNLRDIEDVNGDVEIALSIGTGTIQLVAKSDDVSELEVGTGVSVTAGRTDLVKIGGVKPMTEPLTRQHYEER